MRRKASPSGKKPKSVRQTTELPWWKKYTHWLIFVFAIVLYANTIGHEYTQDDAIVIYDNMFTTQGIEGISGLLSKDTFFGFFKEEGKDRLVSGGRYRPLTPVMFALEWELFGESPLVGHIVNLLCYGLICMLLYFFTRSVANAFDVRVDSWLFAVIATVMFAAHPVHTEVVANIKGRDEIMSFLLSVAALYLPFHQGKSRNILTLVLSGFLFFLALMSKENAITFLAVAPLCFYLAGWDRKEILKYSLGFIAGALIFLVLRGQVIGWEFGETPKEMMNNPFIKVEGGRYLMFTAAEKFATILFILGKYVQLMFFPHPLTHDYYPRHIPVMDFGDWQVWLSLVVYAGLIWSAVRYFRKKPLLSFGILWFLLTISIVSNIIFPVGTNMSERFLFMPSMGFAIAVAGLLIRQKFLPKKVIYWMIALVILAFSIKTVIRNTAWKNNYTLFTTDVHISPNSAKMLSEAGGELTTQAAKLEVGPRKTEMLEQAIQYLNKSTDIHPNYKLSYLLLGNAHYYLGNYDEAIRNYQNVLKIDPDNAEAQKNLGVVYREAGREYGEKKGDLRKAMDYLSRAYQLLPNDYETVHAYGVASGLSGNPQKALELFKKGVELAPNNATAYFNLGLAYYQIGDEESAQKSYDKAVEIDPEILKRRSKQQ